MAGQNRGKYTGSRRVTTGERYVEGGGSMRRCCCDIVSNFGGHSVSPFDVI
jgi:hypothetical protein